MTLNELTQTPAYQAASALSQDAFKAVRDGNPNAARLTAAASAAYAALTKKG